MKEHLPYACMRTASLTLILLCVASRCSPAQLSQEQLLIFKEAQELYFNQQFDSAEEKLIILREERPTDIASGILHAKIKIYTKDFEAAERILSELTDEHPNNGFVLLWRGKLLLLTNRHDEATLLFQQIVAADPENYVAHYMLGRCFERVGKVDLALYEYQTALAVQIQAKYVHRHMASLFDKLNMKERSEKHTRAALVLNELINPGDLDEISQIEQ